MSNVFLSRLEIPLRTALKCRLRSAYDLHQYLWKCFPDRPEARRDFLFRAEHTNDGITVLLTSMEQPLAPDGSVLHGTKELDAEFPAGAFYHFRLYANPTVRSRETKSLQAVIGEENLLAWLKRKGELHGFALRSEPEFSTCRVEEFRKKSGGAASILLNVVEIRGVLAVSDGATFSAAFRSGIGRGRAFGCGMLLLKRIQL